MDPPPASQEKEGVGVEGDPVGKKVFLSSLPSPVAPQHSLAHIRTHKSPFFLPRSISLLLMAPERRKGVGPMGGRGANFLISSSTYRFFSPPLLSFESTPFSLAHTPLPTPSSSFLFSSPISRANRV